MMTVYETFKTAGLTISFLKKMIKGAGLVMNAANKEEAEKKLDEAAVKILRELLLKLDVSEDDIAKWEDELEEKIQKNRKEETTSSRSTRRQIAKLRLHSNTQKTTKRKAAKRKLSSKKASKSSGKKASKSSGKKAKKSSGKKAGKKVRARKK